MSVADIENWVTDLVGAITSAGINPTFYDLGRVVAVLDARPAEGLPARWHAVADEVAAWVQRVTQVPLPAFRPSSAYVAALRDPLPPHHAWQDRKDVA